MFCKIPSKIAFTASDSSNSSNVNDFKRACVVRTDGSRKFPNGKDVLNNWKYKNLRALRLNSAGTSIFPASKNSSIFFLTSATVCGKNTVGYCVKRALPAHIANHWAGRRFEPRSLRP